MEDEDNEQNNRLNAWTRMVYYLAQGDVTRWEPVLRSNAILCFTHLAFEKFDPKFVQAVKQ